MLNVSPRNLIVIICRNAKPMTIWKRNNLVDKFFKHFFIINATVVFEVINYIVFAV